MTNVPSPIRIVKTDFRAGEIDPQLYMRTDSKAYPSGAKSLKNCLLRAGGSVSRRPGSTRLATLASKRRLRSFEFDADEKYILAFGVQALTIYDGAGAEVTSFSTAGDCPWGTQAKVDEMTMAQAGDTVVICHESFRPKVLKRTGLTTFTMSNYTFTTSPENTEIYQPYYKFEQADVTLDISSTSTGTNRTVTASAAIFSAAWVGITLRIFGNECTITSYISPTKVRVTTKRTIRTRLDSNPFRTELGSTVTEVTHAFHGLSDGASITIENSPAIAGVAANNINGSRTITAIIDEDRYTFSASGANNSGYTIAGDFGGDAIIIRTSAPTRNWDEQAFSNVRGWPSAVAFHEDRLWFGGSTSLPDGLFASRTGRYFNFDVDEGQDDASIQLTVASPRMARIRHILSGPALQIFTDGAEFVARQSDGAGMTPANITIRPQTPYGCGIVAPKAFDGATVFVQANGKSVREFSYTDSRDGFQAVDLTTLSQHLIPNVADCDVLYGSESMTEQYAFFVMSDGTMAVFHSNRAEGLAGWTPWETVSTHAFESVCVLGSNLYVAVLRDGTRYLEQIEMDDPDSTLDWSVSLVNGSPTTSWALGAAYASKTVHLVSNGWYLGSVTADGSGNITAPNAVDEITAGLFYEWEVIPLPPDTEMRDGPITGEKRRINAVNIHFLNTLSASVDGRAIVIASIGADLSVPPTPISRKVRRFLLGYDRDPVVTLTQSAPLPVTVLGMTMEVSI